jgi:hypothetical protein
VLDYALAEPAVAWEPLGVMKHSAVAGLWKQGQAHYNAPPGADASIDLPTWFDAFPTSALDSPVSRAAAIEYSRHHSAMGIPIGPVPAPTLIANGFTDDIFPVNQALRWVNRVRETHPEAIIAELYGDFGHRRANQSSEALLKPRALAWFRKHLQGADVEVVEGVEAFVQRCGGGFGERHVAERWAALSSGEIRQAFEGPVVVDSRAEMPRVSRQIDPPSGHSEGVQSDSCRRVNEPAAAGTAVFGMDRLEQSATLIGSPTVVATVSYDSQRNAVLVARLWQEDPEGVRTLVSRGVYRPDPAALESTVSDEIVFQLFANAWSFEAGSRPVLQILGRSTPYIRAPETAFEITIESLELRLPSAEGPDPHERVDPPARRPLPEGMRRVSVRAP